MPQNSLDTKSPIPWVAFVISKNSGLQMAALSPPVKGKMAFPDIAAGCDHRNIFLFCCICQMIVEQYIGPCSAE